MLLTTEGPVGLEAALAAAEAMDLPVTVTEYRSGSQCYRYTRIQLGTVLVPAFDEPRWRDLGDGPSWQEKYTVEEALTVPLLWEPQQEYGWTCWRVHYPVTSLVRQGGAKWGGVSIVARDDTEPRASTHTHNTYSYQGCQELGTRGTLFGFVASLADGVSFREAPYGHDPSKSRWVLDLG